MTAGTVTVVSGATLPMAQITVVGVPGSGVHPGIAAASKAIGPDPSVACSVTFTPCAVPDEVFDTGIDQPARRPGPGVTVAPTGASGEVPRDSAAAGTLNTRLLANEPDGDGPYVADAVRVCGPAESPRSSGSTVVTQGAFSFLGDQPAVDVVAHARDRRARRRDRVALNRAERSSTFAGAKPAGDLMARPGWPVTAPTANWVIVPPEKFATYSEPPDVVMPNGGRRLGSPNCVNAPSVAMRPSVEVPTSVNHSAPSGPAVMPDDSATPAAGNVVIAPPVVIRPIGCSPWLANHSAPSGPAVMPEADATSNPEYIVNVPPVVMRPIRLLSALVNHSAPSGPAVIAGGLFTWAPEKALTTPPC